MLNFWAGDDRAELDAELGEQDTVSKSYLTAWLSRPMLSKLELDRPTGSCRTQGTKSKGCAWSSGETEAEEL
ncbi:hypothetical protein BpHYR1_011987 [Brachionus plicatilis]|uniref:Uncharacterized protein n=1 Tax=Brachionus plicatilis TaxID=10195 RepID=A0A3M7RZK4_BRAPC|nr:hypothetical protein BpHYR1_011987 [Brachionus plicatilis]